MLKGEKTTAVQVVSPWRALYQKINDASVSIIRQYWLTASGGTRARFSASAEVVAQEGCKGRVQTSVILAVVAVWEGISG